MTRGREGENIIMNKGQNWDIKVIIVLFALVIVCVVINRCITMNSIENERDVECDKHEYCLIETANMLICRNCRDVIAFDKYQGLYLDGNKWCCNYFGLYSSIKTEPESKAESEIGVITFALFCIVTVPLMVSLIVELIKDCKKTL